MRCTSTPSVFNSVDPVSAIPLSAHSKSTQLTKDREIEFETEKGTKYPPRAGFDGAIFPSPGRRCPVCKGMQSGSSCMHGGIGTGIVQVAPAGFMCLGVLVLEPQLRRKGFELQFPK
eukprot:3381676-Amphidinium_carterae.2